jgi:uncharacterized membrane protein
MPSPLLLIVLLFSIALLLAVVQLGLITIAFDRLGLSPASAVLLLITSVLGSGINLPLFRVKAEAPKQEITPRLMWRLLRQEPPPFTGSTLIAINVGGGLIPVSFCAHILSHNPLPVPELLIAIAIVTTISYLASRPIHGFGVGMPLLIAPITAAIVALLLDPAHSAPLAYICGTLGVLIGADIFRLGDIRKMGVSVAAIGGAGTFDGIFITGIVAALLA